MPYGIHRLAVWVISVGILWFIYPYVHEIVSWLVDSIFQ